MSPKQPREATNLFAAAGMEQDAPRPLPDRLRPRRSPTSSARITSSVPTAR